MRRVQGVIAVLAAALALAACTSGSGRAPAPGSAHTAAGVTRWWSDAAGTAGSAVSITDPSKVAAKLQVSRPTYCSMLAATVNGGRALFPSASAHDPALVAGTTAFVTELTKVAPPDISPSWAVLSPVIISVVSSGGSLASLRAHVDEAAVSKAVAAVAADAKTNCSLNLAATQ